MENNNIKQAKQALRQQLLLARNNLGQDQRAEASAKIVAALARQAAFNQAKVIFSFMPMDTEVQLLPLYQLARKEGKEICFPVCYKQGRMEAYLPLDPEQMEADRYGILAPNPDLDQLVQPDQIDLTIVPMLTYDRELYRLGYGGGFYDRYLKRIGKSGQVIGVCFADLASTKPLPRGYFDLPLPVIITDKECLKAD